MNHQIGTGRWIVRIVKSLIKRWVTLHGLIREPKVNQWQETGQQPRLQYSWQKELPDQLTQPRSGEAASVPGFSFLIAVKKQKSINNNGTRYAERNPMSRALAPWTPSACFTFHSNRSLKIKLKLAYKNNHVVAAHTKWNHARQTKKKPFFFFQF